VPARAWATRTCWEGWPAPRSMLAAVPCNRRSPGTRPVRRQRSDLPGAGEAVGARVRASFPSTCEAASSLAGSSAGRATTASGEAVGLIEQGIPGDIRRPLRPALQTAQWSQKLPEESPGGPATARAASESAVRPSSGQVVAAVQDQACGVKALSAQAGSVAWAGRSPARPHRTLRSRLGREPAQAGNLPGPGQPPAQPGRIVRRAFRNFASREIAPHGCPACRWGVPMLVITTTSGFSAQAERPPRFNEPATCPMTPQPRRIAAAPVRSRVARHFPTSLFSLPPGWPGTASSVIQGQAPATVRRVAGFCRPEPVTSPDGGLARLSAAEAASLLGRPPGGSVKQTPGHSPAGSSWSCAAPPGAAWGPKRCASTKEWCGIRSDPPQGNKAYGRLPGLAAVGAVRPPARLRGWAAPTPESEQPRVLSSHLAASLSVVSVYFEQ